MLGLSFQRQRQPRWETQLDCQIVELCKIVLLDLLYHFSSEHLPLVFERVATFLVRHSKAGWWFGGRPEFTRGRKGKGWSGWDGGILAWPTKPTSILTTGGRVLEAKHRWKIWKIGAGKVPSKVSPRCDWQRFWSINLRCVFWIHCPWRFQQIMTQGMGCLKRERYQISFHPWMASRLRLCRKALVFVWDLGVNPTTFTRK